MKIRYVVLIDASTNRRLNQARGRKDLLDADVKKLRSSEKIEYGKNFSPPVFSPQAGKTAL